MDEWKDPVCSPGRPSTSKPLVSVTVRMPRWMLEEIDAKAAKEGLNRSQFFRKAVSARLEED